MSKRTVRVRPGRQSSLLGGIVGAVFVIIGLVMAIPTFGLFGVLWTLIAAAIAGVNLYNAFSSKGTASHEIIIEGNEEAAPGEARGETPEARLARLEDLYNRRVITREEYEAQRAEIIKSL